MAKSKSHELRCFCSSEPLLATYGIDADGLLYVHVKVFKQRRVYGEMIVYGGRVKLHCRNCLRWHTVNIVQPDTAVLAEDLAPEELTADA